MVTTDVVVCWVIYAPSEKCPHYMLRRNFTKMCADDLVSRELAPFGTVPDDDNPLVEHDREVHLGTLAQVKALLPLRVIPFMVPGEEKPSIVGVWLE